MNDEWSRCPAQVDRKRNEQRIKDEVAAQKGWFSGWFSSEPSTAATNNEGYTGNVIKNLQAEMTPEEKSKLYAAIGYDENSAPTDYPTHFVEHRFEFFLKKLAILLHEPSNKSQPVILLSSLSKVELAIEQRLAAKALKATVTVGGFMIDGCPLLGETPRLVRPLQGN